MVKTNQELEMKILANQLFPLLKDLYGIPNTPTKTKHERARTRIRDFKTIYETWGFMDNQRMAKILRAIRYEDYGYWSRSEVHAIVAIGIKRKLFTGKHNPLNELKEYGLYKPNDTTQY